MPGPLASRMLPRMSDDPITRLNAALEGRYRIERELGEGGRHDRIVASNLISVSQAWLLPDEK